MWPLPHPAAAPGFNHGYNPFLNPTDSFYGKTPIFNHELNPVLAQQMNQYTLAMQNPDHFNQALQQVQQMAGFPPTSALNQV